MNDTKINQIDTTILDENIPRDLVKAYSNAHSEYPSQRRPNYLNRHAFVNNATYRGSIPFDYHNATYEKITPEEAIAYVKQDKHNIENLRIIFNSSLVEYEVRDNGTIYAITGSSDPVTLPSSGRSFKNIRYAPWKRVLEDADVIYKTDEYQQKLEDNPEVVDRRAKNNKYVPQMSVQTKAGVEEFEIMPDYAHKPFTSNKKTVKFGVVNPDTGYHVNMPYPRVNLGQKIYLNDDKYLNNDEYAIQAEPIDSKLQRLLRSYYEVKTTKKRMFDAYDRSRKALKAMTARAKYFENDPEFTLRLNGEQLEKSLRYDYYIQACKELTEINDELNHNISQLTSQSNQKVQSYALAIETLFDKLKELNQKLNRLNNIKFKPVDSHEWVAWDDRPQEYFPKSKQIMHEIDELYHELLAKQAKVEDLRNALKDLSDELSRSELQSELDVEYNDLVTTYYEIDSGLNEIIETQFAQELAKVTLEINDTVKELNELKSKHLKKGDSGEAKLDPDLENIIDFV